MGYKINNEETKVIDDIMNRLNEAGLIFELPEEDNNSKEGTDSKEDKKQS